MSPQKPSNENAASGKASVAANASTQKTVKPAARRKARTFALQALYQCQIAQMSAGEVEAQFRINNDMRKTDVNYFHELLSGVMKHLDEIDQVIKPYLDIKQEELDPIELNAMRIGSFELLHRVDIPYRVAINESIELVKKFGGEESHKFVNGVLDKVAAKARVMELKADQQTNGNKE